MAMLLVLLVGYETWVIPCVRSYLSKKLRSFLLHGSTAAVVVSCANPQGIVFFVQSPGFVL
jgi:hypothetical protein